MSAFARTVNYASVNEDWRTEARALQSTEDDVVLCVTGSGDRPLDQLIDAPSTVVALDLNPAQNHLLRVKLAAAQVLDSPDHERFMGLESATRRERAELWRRIRAAVGPETAAWGDAWPGMSCGILYQGRWERHYRRLAAVGRALRAEDLDRLFAFEDLDAQRAWVRDHWDTPLWRAAWRVTCSPLASRVVFGDPAFFAHVHVDPSTYLYERFAAGFGRHLARDSFMAALVFQGRLQPHALPPYLTPEGRRLTVARAGGLSIVTADLLDHLEASPRRYTRFSLSDVPSFLDEAGFARLLQGVVNAARPGARVVIRQFMTRHVVPPALASRLLREPELEAELAREDRSFCYEFLIATVRAP